MEFDESDSSSDLNLSLVLVGILKEYPILIEKSQLPGVREQKSEAMKMAKQTIMMKTGVVMEEKKIAKKIANMKAQLKKKTDAKITGNKKIILLPWEEELYKLIQGDSNPTISKMSCSMSAGLQPTTLTSSSKVCYSLLSFILLH